MPSFWFCKLADVQDRDGAAPVLHLPHRTAPFIAVADYAGDRPAKPMIVTIEIVRTSPGQIGCAVHPRGWVVDPSTGSR